MREKVSRLEGEKVKTATARAPASYLLTFSPSHLLTAVTYLLTFSPSYFLTAVK
jgi:hypothetical protein